MCCKVQCTGMKIIKNIFNNRYFSENFIKPGVNFVRLYFTLVIGLMYQWDVLKTYLDTRPLGFFYLSEEKS